MNVNDARSSLQHIRRAADRQDDERAHQAQDDFHLAVLTAIAHGDDDGDPAALAAEALKAEDIAFSRWYA